MSKDSELKILDIQIYDKCVKSSREIYANSDADINFYYCLRHRNIYKQRLSDFFFMQINEKPKGQCKRSEQSDSSYINIKHYKKVKVEV